MTLWLQQPAGLYYHNRHAEDSLETEEKYIAPILPHFEATIDLRAESNPGISVGRMACNLLELCDRSKITRPLEIEPMVCSPPSRILDHVHGRLVRVHGN